MPDSPSRLAAALADRYRIERELGQGGMATVYLAQDLKHERKVAVKVLRPELAAVIGAERFLSEIKTTANLQHPHILPLFDSGRTGGNGDDRADDFLFYVMPLIEGESLRDRLNREKQLPIGDALRIATEVASALDYAHRHNVIHRDIKPENVLLHDGRALVADFGIALAASKAGGSRMTETGMSLGTPTYMSPEQAMGEREITARSDVYALGAMTYEMLLGEPPFTGPTAQSIVAKVMTEKPASLISRRDRISPAVEDAVLTALEKLPADRFGSAAEFSAALNGDEAKGRVTESPSRRAVGRSSADAPGRRAALYGALALTSLAAVFFAWRAAHHPAGPVTRLTLDLPELRVNHLSYYGSAIAVAPDGSSLVYVTESPGKPTRLMVRERGNLTPRLLEGTDEADGPFFSPDGRWVAYTAGKKIFKVPVAGGSPVLVADAAANELASGTWLDDGRIVFTNQSFEILTVPAAGGQVSRVVPPPVSFGWAFPTALPVKDVILITECSNNCSRTNLMAMNLKTLAQDTILANTARGFYLPTGDLLAVQQDGNVVAGHFDLGKLRYTNPPVVVQSAVQLELGITPELAVSNDGTLIYLAANQTGTDATIARVDRTGKPRVLDPDWTARVSSLALSPDGRRLGISTLEQAGNVLWMKELDAGPLTQLSFDGTINYRPSWRPDGRSVSFTSDFKGLVSYLYTMRADGSDKPERVMPNEPLQVDEAVWSRDGHWLVYRTGVTGGVRDIYARQLSGDTTRITVAAGAADEYMPALSPDGRWISYVSVESGKEEVYVRPFPETSRARWQVSAAGGSNPAWSHSGRELFYVDRADSLISVSVTGTTDFQIGPRRALFSTRPFLLLPLHRTFDVFPDDQSFLMLKRPFVGSTEANRLTVVLNWFSEVEAKVRQGR